MSKPPRTSLEHWAMLQAVIDHGGFEAAAEALGRSQSAISYGIKRLQERLPVALLEQRGRRSLPTAAGERLLRRSRVLLEEAQRLERLAATLAEGWAPEVRLALDAVVTPQALVVEALAAFAGEAPQIRVELIESVLSGASDALLQRRVDLAITPLVPPGFLGEALIEVEFVAVAHPEHPLHRLGRTLGIADLRQHRQVVVRDSGQQQIDRGWLGADARWTVSQLESAVALIRRGLAFAWIPRAAIAAALASGALRELDLVEGGRYRVTLYLVHAEHDEAGPAVDALTRSLFEAAARVAD
ncbi:MULTISPECIES: LysR family transcriptional regulator [unclassified Marichromatium]|uniref:LysR family transcriptional regulator n=1 Tax=unclassified Marichromatium TaxID=2618417 RepID=UPI000F3E20BE|nr:MULTISPECIES: LysR family transcriptional regulator [unclassified Marichromatium]RNE91871.1 LysR family transcriptional regulator [Marichromatium sp. AB31]RNE92569.1 LysR family transcriptional regulator [Marichromatium sp. AB32]